MSRFSLRTFLIVCAALGVCISLLVKWFWLPWIGLESNMGATNGGIRYGAYRMVDHTPFGSELLNVVVPAPAFVNHSAKYSSIKTKLPDGDGLDIMPSGVYLEGKRIGGFGTARVVIVLGEGDVRVIELSAADIQSLEAAAGPEMIQSPVWKEKVESEIDRLVRARRNIHDRHALGLPP